MKIAFSKNKNSIIPDTPTKKKSIQGAKDFERFYNASAEKLFHVALRIVNDKEIAEGIVHDVFSDIWERRDVLKINAPIEVYAVKAVKFSAFDKLKEKIKKEKASQDLHLTTITFNNPIEEEIHARELKTKIARLIDKLPTRCQEVFRLRREKQLSNKEIAVGMNISEKTVERHMTRALQFLKLGLK